VKDPIVEEVRRVRREMFAAFGYDIKRYTDHLKRRWRNWPAGHVSFDPHDPKPLQRPTDRTASEPEEIYRQEEPNP
jgi:hypothetical protein